MSKNFWKNKRILITGIAGFVGSNLAKELSNLGAKVSGIDKNKNQRSLLYYEKIHQSCNIYHGSITNQKFVNKIIKKEKIQICFHLGAQAEVGIANANPYNTWESNVRGSYTILESIRKSGKYIKAIIVASSDKAYGDYPKKKLPYQETYPLNALYPYDTSKACQDLICRSYALGLYKLPIVVTRFTNIYGPGQLNFSALIPDIIRSILLNKQFTPRSDGLPLRDFIFVKDIVDVYLLLAKKIFYNHHLRGEVFNAGTNKPIQIKKMIKKIFTYCNQSEIFNEIEKKMKNKKMKNKKMKGEINYQFMNCKKLYKYFKWKPKYRFDNTLEETLNWYKNYFKKI